MSGYCLSAPGHPFHGPYHDSEYGFPQRDERVLFERLVLEINQAGLSWLTVLKKRAAFQRAFLGFEPAVVARFGEPDVQRLLADAGIIRNKLKIAATIENARRVLALRESHGSFAAWIDAHHPLTQGGVGHAVPPHLRVHRRRDRQRVPDEPGLPAGRASGELCGLPASGRTAAALDAGRRPPLTGF